MDDRMPAPSRFPFAHPRPAPPSWRAEARHPRLGRRSSRIAPCDAGAAKATHKIDYFRLGTGGQSRHGGRRPAIHDFLSFSTAGRGIAFAQHDGERQASHPRRIYGFFASPSPALARLGRCPLPRHRLSPGWRPSLCLTGHRRQSLSEQSGIEIIPGRVVAMNQPHLPRTVPVLHRFFPLNGSGDVVVAFEVDKSGQAVARRKSGGCCSTMLVSPPQDVGRDADIERSVRSVRHDVDPSARHAPRISAGGLTSRGWRAFARHDGEAAVPTDNDIFPSDQAFARHVGETAVPHRDGTQAMTPFPPLRT